MAEKAALEARHLLDQMDHLEELEELELIILQHTELNMVTTDFLVAEELDLILEETLLIVQVETVVEETHLTQILDHQLDLNLDKLTLVVELVVILTIHLDNL